MHGTESRYSRQERFAGIGVEGQRRIAAARVAIVGCGALGSVQAAQLARAGIGFLRIIDRDFVERSNLQRQVLFAESDALEGLPKAAAAARRIAQINSEITVEPVIADLTPANAGDLLDGVHLILDGADNFETRYLINDFAVMHGVPWIYGGAVASHGIKMAIVPGHTACLRCVYPDPPQGMQATCETAGVLNSVTACIASFQCADALRIVASPAETVSTHVLTVDMWSGEIRKTAPVKRDPSCPCCGLRRFEYLNGARRVPISLCGRNAVQIHERARPIDLAELAAKLSALAPVRSNEFALRVALDPYEMTVFPDGRAIVKGTTDVGVARSLYARYVGA